MPDNVVEFFPADAAKDPDNVLKQAIGNYTHVLVVGWDKDGAIDARASLNLKDGADLLWLLELVKFKLLSGDYISESSSDA